MNFKETGKTMTIDQVKATREAISIVAGMCDGANQLDGHGFNKWDTNIGRDLAHRYSWSQAQAALARKIVGKYKKQYGSELYFRMFPKK